MLVREAQGHLLRRSHEREEVHIAQARRNVRHQDVLVRERALGLLRLLRDRHGGRQID